LWPPFSFFLPSFGFRVGFGSTEEKVTEVDMLLVDLDSMSDDELQILTVRIKKELDLRQELRDERLAHKVLETDNDHLKVLAVAMMRHLHGKELGVELPCEDDRTAYYIAEHRLLDHDHKLEQEEYEKLKRQLLRRFDCHDYVFRHTHYDECSNGLFFRRS